MIELVAKINNALVYYTNTLFYVFISRANYFVHC
jgi:hypothetical protein